ncbi:apolipoprotein N-acyltransferase [Campylobacter sp.]|uniref:apolipoprotein N-acyltransferase n=1 Tax=Campylobacter sp. TaxID=205 RepID=UPI002AA920F3|nr:apolipoprotein N-acyltransferase [Campylobacter sp.]MCI7447781.1 apolipoprotein N-acyltransferase [Campylobacter sp.]
MKVDRLALSSFKKKLSSYFSLKIIKSSFLTAILLSIFIYFSIFENIFLSILGLLAFVFGALRLVFVRKNAAVIWLLTGFFVGVFWFYWIAFSLVYYDFAYLIPFEIFGIGVVYGLIFICFYVIFSFFARRLGDIFKPVILALGFYLIQFIHPFGFNWLNWHLSLIGTPFERVLAGQNDSKNPPFKIELISSRIPQSELWQSSRKKEHFVNNLALIDKAIKNGARLVVLPESAFATNLNQNLELIETLKQKSQKIAILTGAEAYENGTFYNSAYFFDAGEMRRIDKHILVPFGEEIPLPEFLKKPINALFFGGASDFGKAGDFSYIEVEGVRFKVAICYEGTRPQLYANKPDFVLLISNDAWFVPSTQSTLQNLLLRYYALKNGSVIFHSANFNDKKVIR